MSAGIGLMEEGRRYVVFAVADRRLAIAIQQVGRVIYAVEITPVPGLPSSVVGAVSLHGEIVPVVDLRRRLGLPERELELSDQFILVQRGALRWFLVSDGVVGVVEFPESSIRARAGADPQECCTSDIHLDEGVVAVLEVSRLLTGEQTSQVRRALVEGLGE